ncbi:MAG: hypothetical protein PHD72_03265 [Patescibacteria group bacterium]|nr:hypothetical protein [Patescibacteria group bacterium]
MRRYIIIFLIFSAVALVATGCAVENSKNQNGNFPPRQNNGDRSSSSTGRVNFGTPTSIEYLAVGKKITIMGTTNADGTVSALNIMLGEMPIFGQEFRSSSGRFASSTMPNAQEAPQNFQPTSGDTGQWQRRDGGDRLDGRAGPPSDGQRINRSAGQTRISGEILEIDKFGLVLKLADGGSKIVFYSDKTGVFNMPTSTPQFARPDASSTTPSDVPPR